MSDDNGAATFSWGSDTDANGSTIGANSTEVYLPPSATDGDIALVVQRCKQLQQLHLNGCDQCSNQHDHAGPMQQPGAMQQAAASNRLHAAERRETIPSWHQAVPSRTMQVKRSNQQLDAVSSYERLFRGASGAFQALAAVAHLQVRCARPQGRQAAPRNHRQQLVLRQQLRHRPSSCQASCQAVGEREEVKRSHCRALFTSPEIHGALFTVHDSCATSRRKESPSDVDPSTQSPMR